MALLAPAKTVTVSVPVPAPMYAGIEKRAAALNLRPAEYVRRFVEAGYLARVQAEKGMPADDAELDAAVRAVFALAGAGGAGDVGAIATRTGFPRDLVARILEGFTIAARHLLDVPAAAAAPRHDDAGSVAEAPPAVDGTPAEPQPAEGGGRRGLTDDMVETIRRMWAEGAKVKAIAAAIGKTEGALSVWASKNRDVCPPRVVRK